MSPKVLVEVRFDGTTWVDVSAWLKLASGITVSRGRDGETGDPVSPGTFSLALDNRDGRFSPDLPSSPYYPYVTTQPAGPAVRVSVWANGAWRRRAWGTASAWSVTGLGGVPVCTVTATDAVGTLPSAALRQASDEVLRRYAPTYYWPLRDTASPAQPAAGPLTLTDNGKDGWAQGGRCAMDEGDTAYPLLKGLAAGLKLTTPTLNLAMPCRVFAVVIAAPTDSCDILDLGSAGRLQWNGTGFVLDTAPTLQAIPDSWPALVGMHFVAPSSMLSALYVCGPTGAVRGGTGLPWVSTPIRRLVLNPTLSGGAEFSAGHLMVASSASGITVQKLRPLLSSRLIDGMGDASLAQSSPEFVLSAAAAAGGQWLAIAGAPSGGIMLPPLEGRDAADVMGAMLTGTGARLVDDLAGGLRWVPMLDTTAPVALPAKYGPDLTWQTDSAGWRSDVTVTWPDGTSYTATRADGQRRSASIEGVNPSKAADRSMADWLVNTSSAGARLPVLPIDMMGLTEAQRATACSVGPSTRVALSGLPTQMPSTLACVCEGTEEQITADGWTVTLKLSPDPVSLVGIYGTSTYDSGAIYAP